MYVRSANGAITHIVNRLPESDRRLDTGQWVLGLPTADPTTLAACGWFELTPAPRPADTPTTTFDRSIEITAGVPAVVWTERPKTVDELADDLQDTKEETQLQRLQDNFQTLRNVPPAASLTNAQLRDEVDLLRAMLLDLTRVVRGIAAE